MLDGLPALPTLPGLAPDADRATGLPGTTAGDADAAGGGFAAQLARSSQDLATASSTPTSTGPATPMAALLANPRAGFPGTWPAATQPDATACAAPGTPGAPGAAAAPGVGLPADTPDVAPTTDGPALAGLVLPTPPGADRLPDPVTPTAALPSSDEPADRLAGAPDPASLAAWVAAWTPPAATPPAAPPPVPFGLVPLAGTAPSTADLPRPPLARTASDTSFALSPPAIAAEASTAATEPAVEQETGVAVPAAPDTGAPPVATPEAAPSLPPDASLPALAAQAPPANVAVALPPPTAPARPDPPARAEVAAHGMPTVGATRGAGGDERGGNRIGRNAATPSASQASAADLAAGAAAAAHAAPATAEAGALDPAGMTGADSAAARAADTTGPAQDAFAHRLDGAMQAAPAAANPVASAGGARTEGPAVAVATPATAPEFREALGVQVSVLARDGVQHAELHLNPSEMGPISVRIEIDGNQAQVNFGVDHAGTRAIVEAGLPELASALREAGLTLTGGGVSDHARGPGGEAGAGGSRQDGAPQDRPEGRRGGPGRGDPPEAAPPVARRVRLPGGVDVYA